MSGIFDYLRDSGLISEPGDLGSGVERALEEDSYGTTMLDTRDGVPSDKCLEMARKASAHVSYGEDGSIAPESNFILKDFTAERELFNAFGDMMLGIDRNSRTIPRRIKGESSYAEVGAAVIGVGLAAAKVDDVGETDLTPAYDQFFIDILEDNSWNVSPDIKPDDFEDELDGKYSDIVQETAEEVEDQLLDIRDHSEEVRAARDSSTDYGTDIEEFEVEKE